MFVPRADRILQETQTEPDIMKISRHNENIYYGTAEIVSFLEYLIRRSSGKYLPSNPLSYRLKRRKNMFAHKDNDNSYEKPGNSIIPQYRIGTRDRLYSQNAFNKPVSQQ